MHMNIAFSLMNAIKERQIDALFSMEEAALSKQSKAAFLEAVRDPEKKPVDKLRLFLIFYLSVPDVTKDDVLEFQVALEEAGCDTSSIKYIKRYVIPVFTHQISVLNFGRMAAANIAQTTSTASNGSDIFGKFTSIGTKLSDTLQNAGVSGGFDSFISGVKNLLPSKKQLQITRTVDCFMEGNNTSEFEDYLYLDPKISRGSGTKPKGQQRMFHSDAIVFVVGGGNYLEHQNLLDYAQVINRMYLIIRSGSNVFVWSDENGYIWVDRDFDC